MAAYLLLLLTHFALLTAAATCYFPNGVVSPSDTPCNPNAEESFCCYGLQICSDNKFCMDPVSSTIWHRGSCTDKTWGPACQQFCQNVSTSTGSPLTPCTNDGEFLNKGNDQAWSVREHYMEHRRPKQNEWVCGIDKLDCLDSTKILSLGVPIPTAMASGRVLTASSTAPISSACPTASSLPQNNPIAVLSATGGLTSGEKIGLGIGIPLAVLLLVSSGSAAYFVRKRFRQAPINSHDERIPRAWGKRESSEMSEWTTRNSKAVSVSWKEAKSKSIIVEAPDALAASVELPAYEAKKHEASPIVSTLGSWFKD